MSRALYIDPLVYSTYLGGSGADQGYGIAVDSSGDAYVDRLYDVHQLSGHARCFPDGYSVVFTRRVRDRAQPHGISFGLLHLSWR